MNTIGTLFRISLFGESHGPCVGVTIDGCPPGMEVNQDMFLADLERRKGGKPGTTARKEEDLPELLSGIYNGFSTGAPITILFKNKDAKPDDYNAIRNTPRPGHADFVAQQKYQGFQDPIGGGHFSGRLTAGLVAAGVIAKKIISPVEIQAELIMAGGRTDWQTAVEEARSAGDSLGGLVEVKVDGLPAGLGEPFFDSLESRIAHMAFSVPAIKGIEFGSGFAAASMKGSGHNDIICNDAGNTITNNAGGINGGLSNGNQLVFRVAVKPTSSISIPQMTWNTKEKAVVQISVPGRHDACIAIRVPVVMEAITAIALADFKLISRG
jgi:chorismate synthase